MPALFVGRFQPFHNGHLDALKQIFEKERDVIIVIGSSEDNYVPENPFTAGERWQMIQAALKGKNLTIVPVRNIRSYALWVHHLEVLLPPFEKVYTGSPVVKRLFEEAGYKVVPIKIRKKVSATSIRRQIKEGNGWESLVPKAVTKLLKQWSAEERLKNL